MANGLPKYGAPPVVETVLGVQFERLRLLTAHAGWFWKNYLEGEWSTATEVSRLQDTFEREDLPWGRPGLRVLPAPEASRLQLIRADEQRMIQVQDSRFIYNWKKGEGQYPSYEVLLPEFEGHFEKFRQFVQDAEVGELELNQWEVVYVNFLPKGDLWNSPEDWQKIFPRFSVPTDELQFVTFTGTWSHLLGNHRGRLHIESRHNKTQEDEEVIRLQLTARGPINEEQTLEQGFALGHETIVNAFTDMTSDTAHKHWKRTT